MQNININRILSLISIVIILFTASCSKEQSERGINSVSSEEILVTGSDENAETKTSLDGLVTSWKGGNDTIGIFSEEAIYYKGD